MSVLPALALALLLGACAPEPVTARTRLGVAQDLARAAAAGFPARVVEIDPDAFEAERRALLAAPPPPETTVLVSLRDVAVVPSPRFEPFVRAGFEAHLRKVWVRPYLEAHDLDGALVGAARGYLRALQDNGLAEKLPPPLAVRAPNRHRLDFPSGHLQGGFLFSALLAAGLAAVAARARRAASPAGDPRPWTLARVAALMPGLGLGLAAAVALGTSLTTLDHDAALYLHCGRRLLDGATPYVDLVELNPPLAWAVYALPALLDRAVGPLGFGPAGALHLFVLALTALSAREVLRRAPDAARGATLVGLVGIALAALTVPFRAAWLDGWVRLPLAAWGQREHLFVLAALPWLATRAARERGVEISRAGAVGAGLAAGLAGSLKPQLGLLLLAVEAAALVGRGGAPGRTARLLAAARAPESWALGAPPLLYALQFALWPAAARNEAFGHVIPLVARTYGATFGIEGSDLALRSLATVALVAAAGVALVATRPAGGAPGNAPPEGAGDETAGLRARAASLALFGLLVAIGQGKGFPYHYLPAQAGAILALALAAAGPARRAATRLVGPLSLVATAAVLALPAHRLGEGFVAPLERALDYANLPPGSRVLVLNDAVVGGFPTLLLRGVEPSGRYPWLFPLALAQSLPDAERVAEEARLAFDLAEDLRRSPPEVVFAASEPMQSLPAGFDVRAWMEGQSALASLLGAYEPPRRAGPWWVYVLRGGVARTPAEVPVLPTVEPTAE